MKYAAVTLFALSVMCASGCAHRVTGSISNGGGINLGASGVPTNTKGTSITSCPKGIQSGEVDLAFKNGRRKLRGRCVAGKMHGMWKSYYNNGATYWVAHFDKGQLHGKLSVYWPNDKKKAVAHFVNGVADGGSQSWWDNGKTRHKGAFVDGTRGGCWETFYKNGRVSSKGTYSGGKRVLTWLNWDAYGKRTKQKLGGEANHGKCLITL